MKTRVETIAQTPQAGSEKETAQPPRLVLRTVVFHAALLAVVFGLMGMVLPKVTSIFADLGVALPAPTRFVFDLSRLALFEGLFVFPLLIAADVAACFLARTLFGPRALRWWSGTVVTGLILFVLASGGLMLVWMCTIVERVKPAAATTTTAASEPPAVHDVSAETPVEVLEAPSSGAGLETDGNWAVEKWVNANAGTLRIATDKNQHKMVSVHSAGGNQDKFAFERGGPALYLGDSGEMTFNVFNSGENPLKLSVAFADDSGDFYETRQRSIPANVWSSQSVNLDSPSFQRPREFPEYSAPLGGRDHVSKIIFMIYGHGPAGLTLTNLCFREKDERAEKQKKIQEELTRLEKSFDRAGGASSQGMQAHEDKIAELKAELDGDQLRLARRRLLAGLHHMENAQPQYERGTIEFAEYQAAQTDLAGRLAALRAAEAAQNSVPVLTPEVEKVIGTSETSERSVFCFDMLTGAISKSAFELPRDQLTADVQHWAEANRATLTIIVDPYFYWDAAALKIQLFSKLHEGIQDWDKVTPENISAFVLELNGRSESSRGDGGIMGLHANFTGRQAPPTSYYVFRTRDESATGVMQFEPVTETLQEGEHRRVRLAGIKIKYRFLKMPNPPAKTGASVETNRATNFNPEIQKTAIVSLEAKARLESARRVLDLTTKKFNAGLVNKLDVAKAQRDVETLEAEVHGETVETAKTRLETMRMILKLTTALCKDGVLDVTEMEKARLDADLGEINVRKVEAARAAPPN